MSITETSQEMINVTKNTEVSTNVHTGGQGYDYLMNLLANKTREYSFMTFEDLRVSLGKNDWGKKIFFDTMLTMKIICKTPPGKRIINPNKPNMEKQPDGTTIDIGYVTSSSYLPCKEAAIKYPKLFSYDHEVRIFGFDGEHLEIMDDDFLAEMNDISIKLRKMYAEERRISKKLSSMRMKIQREVNGNDS